MTDPEIEQISEEEEEEREEETLNDTTYSIKKILQLVMSSKEPVSEDPRYLLYLKNYLGKIENLPIDLKLVLPHFSNVAKYMLKNEKKLKKNGYLALLENCEEAKVITSQTFLIAPLVSRLMKFVTTCNETEDPSLEDFSSLVATTNTFTSRTTAASQMDHADAGSSKKRKIVQESEDEDDLFEEDLFQLPSLKPTYETFSSILLRERKGEKLKTSKLEDEWKDSKMKLVYWKTEDLADARSEDEWRNARKTMMLNFDSTSPDGLIIMEAIRAIEKKTRKHLKQNGGKPIEFSSKRKRY
uniref:NS2 n=1 Tax=uncultured densovirus TaxID=748192 RepID=A0A7M4BC24_9VIRU|nr:NS2 [uncultured densovirus]QOD39522.1 NS2 [uncultured densovirus]